MNSNKPGRKRGAKPIRLITSPVIVMGRISISVEEVAGRNTHTEVLAEPIANTKTEMITNPETVSRLITNPVIVVGLITCSVEGVAGKITYTEVWAERITNTEKELITMQGVMAVLITSPLIWVRRVTGQSSNTEVWEEGQRWPGSSP